MNIWLLTFILGVKFEFLIGRQQMVLDVVVSTEDLADSGGINHCEQVKDQILEFVHAFEHKLGSCTTTDTEPNKMHLTMLADENVTSAHHLQLWKTFVEECLKRMELNGYGSYTFIQVTRRDLLNEEEPLHKQIEGDTLLLEFQAHFNLNDFGDEYDNFLGNNENVTKFVDCLNFPTTVWVNFSSFVYNDTFGDTCIQLDLDLNALDLLKANSTFFKMEQEEEVTLNYCGEVYFSQFSMLDNWSQELKIGFAGSQDTETVSTTVPVTSGAANLGSDGKGDNEYVVKAKE